MVEMQCGWEPSMTSLHMISQKKSPRRKINFFEWKKEFKENKGIEFYIIN
jgi:hypothetical protein